MFFKYIGYCRMRKALKFTTVDHSIAYLGKLYLVILNCQFQIKTTNKLTTILFICAIITLPQRVTLSGRRENLSVAANNSICIVNA